MKDNDSRRIYEESYSLALLYLLVIVNIHFGVLSGYKHRLTIDFSYPVKLTSLISQRKMSDVGSLYLQTDGGNNKSFRLDLITHNKLSIEFPICSGKKGL